MPMRRLAFLVLGIIYFGFLSGLSPVHADTGIVVESRVSLLEALSSDVSAIGISGDILLEEPLKLDHDVELRRNGEAASLTFDANQALTGEDYSQSMIVVDGAAVTLNGLDLRIDNDVPVSDAYFWSLVSVENGGALTLDGCHLMGTGMPSKTLSPIDENYYREALNGVTVQQGALTARTTAFNGFEMSGILLGTGAESIDVEGNLFDRDSVGIMTVHEEATDYEAAESAIRQVRIISNDFGSMGFGVVLLPNVEGCLIENNRFGLQDPLKDISRQAPEIAGALMLPVGIQKIPELLRSLDLLSGDPTFDEIHDLITTHLVFPDDEALSRQITLASNQFHSSMLGTALVGGNEAIQVNNNSFFRHYCGSLEAGFPGTLLGQLLDLVIANVDLMAGQGKSSLLKQAASEHSFPDYDTQITYEGNLFNSCMVGAAVGFNAGALFDGNEILSVSSARSPALRTGNRNAFVENGCGILLANGPGAVTIQQNDFIFNDIAVADVGYDLIYDAVLHPYLVGAPESFMDDLDEIVDEFVSAGGSSLLIQGCRFDLDRYDGIWILNDGVRANIRHNNFSKTLDSGGLEREALSVPAKGATLTVPGSTAIRVGLNDSLMGSEEDFQCVPERVSITENTFRVNDLFNRLSASEPLEETSVPASYVLFDMADTSMGEFDLHLNRFLSLERISGDEYNEAVVVLGDDEIDGANNLWKLNDKAEAIVSEDQVTPYIVGPLAVSPLLTDEEIDKDQDLKPVVSGDIIIYTGTADGTSFDVEVASGDQESLILKPVTQEEAESAFTDEELEDLGNLFFLPVDIRIDEDYAAETLTFRFENRRGLTGEELVVKTTTPNGALIWGDNAYISDDGDWIVLEVGPETTPSLSDFTGSVTMAASNVATSTGSGGCQAGLVPVSALLLLLPIMGLKR